MNRKISWVSRELDEIGLVYEKAERNERTTALLEKLETQALCEAKENVGMLKTNDVSFLTPDQFDAFSEIDKKP